MADALRNASQIHLIDVLLRCLSKTSYRHLLKLSPGRIFFKFQKKITFIYLFLAFFLIGQNVATTLSFQRCCSKRGKVFTTCLGRFFNNQVSTLQQ